MYEFTWKAGRLISEELCKDLADLYNANYGVWGSSGPRPGAHVKLSVALFQKWLSPRDSRVAIATFMGKPIGYAIAVQRTIPGHGVISWVTQLVVDENFRQQNVGKTLLFTIWGFSDHFAWGLVTANPYAVRALEKATRRRCVPSRVRQHHQLLLSLGTEVAPTYIHTSSETKISNLESRINTKFYLDHSHLPEMLLDVAGPDRVWELGQLEEGWEWFAFTFQDQERFGISRKELDQMLLASDEVTKQAYSRMSGVSATHPWAKHTEKEVEFITEVCQLGANDSVLDFGCDRGRHSLEFAKRVGRVVGVDYVGPAIEQARESARSVNNIEFVVGDCRNVQLHSTFDCVICLYDVIGSFAYDEDNLKILQNIVHHLRPGGWAVISVMNFQTTEGCTKWFSITEDPDALLNLEPSNTMEKTGDIFDPKYYMVDRKSHVVYRKEQFVEGEQLPAELLVRDKRFSAPEIKQLCEAAGLDVLWSRFVRAGRWRDPLATNDPRAKEILVLCQKPPLPQPTLFEQ